MRTLGRFQAGAIFVMALILFMAGCGGSPTAAPSPAPFITPSDPVLAGTIAAERATRAAVQTKAVTDLTATAPTTTPTPSLAAQVDAAWEAGNWVRVISLLKQQPAPDAGKLYAAYYNHCRQLLSLGNKAEATRACQDALAVNPAGTEAQQTLINLAPTATPTRSRTPSPALLPTVTRPPVQAPPPTSTSTPVPAPPGNSGVRIGAVCRDGTTSTATGSGACSSHGGVAYWLYR